jgi:hypothetical protein
LPDEQPLAFGGPKAGRQLGGGQRIRWLKPLIAFNLPPILLEVTQNHLPKYSIATRLGLS